MGFKSKEDYIKEIAEQLNNSKKIELENPNKADVLKLKEFEYIITDGLYFPVIIRKKYTIEYVFGIPTLLWFDGYEIGDTVMGVIPTMYSADEVLEELKAYRGEI